MMKIPYDKEKLSYTKTSPSTPHPIVNLIPNPNILISDELLSFLSYFLYCSLFIPCNLLSFSKHRFHK